MGPGMLRVLLEKRFLMDDLVRPPNLLPDNIVEVLREHYPIEDDIQVAEEVAAFAPLIDSLAKMDITHGMHYKDSEGYLGQLDRGDWGAGIRTMCILAYIGFFPNY